MNDVAGGAPRTPIEGCPDCDGTGWTTVGDEPGAPVRRCSCYHRGGAERRLDNALIPPRYRSVDLDNFSLYNRIDGSLEEAKLIAEKFVAGFRDVDAGLLFEGPPGVGKTHLAVAVLRAIMTRHGVSGRFVDYRDLLRSIQETYNPVSESSEMDVLRPVLAAEVLVIDELGKRRPTVWVQDTVTQLLNDRYKQKRITLITTNFGDDADPSVSSLEDQIGPYARSRLHEMCRTVPMRGKDFREIKGGGNVRVATDPLAAAADVPNASNAT